ncbi:unnamed protein product [Ectocarpus sp. 12 AP-2014]
MGGSLTVWHPVVKRCSGQRVWWLLLVRSERDRASRRCPQFHFACFCIAGGVRLGVPFHEEPICGSTSAHHALCAYRMRCRCMHRIQGGAERFRLPLIGLDTLSFASSGTSFSTLPDFIGR